MKMIISLIGAALLLGAAGCHHPSHQGGSYSEYPYDHHGYYRNDHRKYPGYGHPGYGRNYGYYSGRNYGDYDGRRYPYDRDGYWSGDGYRRY